MCHYIGDNQIHGCVIVLAILATFTRTFTRIKIFKCDNIVI